MKLITRYLLREHVGPFIFAVSTLTSLLLLNYISKKFGELVGKGLPWSVIAEFFVLSIPFTVAMTLPMAVLIATLHAFSRLASDNEATALMANGVGTRQLLTPVLGAGAVLTLVMLAFNDQLLPRTNLRLNGLTASIAQKKPTLTLREQTMNEVSREVLFLQMAHLDNARNMMHEVTIHDLSDPQLRRTIIADSGLLAFAPNGRDLRLTLFDGYVQETSNTNPTDFQRIFFKTDIMRVADVANELSRTDEPGFKGDREMTVCEMQQRISREQRRRDSLRAALAEFDSAAAGAYPQRFGSRLGEWYCGVLAALAPVSEAGAQVVGEGRPMVKRFAGDSVAPDAEAVRLQTMHNQLQRTQETISGFDVEIQKKFAISVACLVFALLGPPIALRFPRGGVGLTIGVSLTVFSIYYVGLIAGEELANDLVVSPIVAMWAANVLLGAVGIVLALRMGKVGANARSGGFSELVYRLFPGKSKTAS